MLQLKNFPWQNGKENVRGRQLNALKANRTIE